MSNDTDHDDEQPDEGGISQLRESSRKGKAALAENLDLKRQLAFAKAGIDTDTKLGKMLFRTWDGEDGDIEALKNEAREIGALAPAEATKTPEQLAAEAARSEEDARRSSAQESMSGGRSGVPSEDEGPNPRDSALEAYHLDMRNGTTPEDAQVTAMAKVIGAGARGHKGVRFDAEAHLQAGREADRQISGHG